MPVYDSTATLGDTTNGKAPNITGSFWYDGCNGGSGYLSGAFTSGAGYYSYRNSNNNHATLTATNLDASLVSSVYDNDATGIIPAGVYTLWCIKF